VIHSHDGCDLQCVAPPPLRTSGQIVGRQAAERLLATTARFDRPIDVFLQMTWVTGVPVLCANPSGISDWPEPMGGSVAQSKPRRGLGESLRREVARTIYRRRIAAIARRQST
jgi:GR25 family glycosyltransferase involved in LPS biosynthesis